MMMTWAIMLLMVPRMLLLAIAKLLATCSQRRRSSLLPWLLASFAEVPFDFSRCFYSIFVPVAIIFVCSSSFRRGSTVDDDDSARYRSYREIPVKCWGQWRGPRTDNLLEPLTRCYSINHAVSAAEKSCVPSPPWEVLLTSPAAFRSVDSIVALLRWRCCAFEFEVVVGASFVCVSER